MRDDGKVIPCSVLKEGRYSRYHVAPVRRNWLDSHRRHGDAPIGILIAHRRVLDRIFVLPFVARRQLNSHFSGDPGC